MGVFSFLLFGFVVGLIARAVTPGDQKLGLVMTALLGIAGSFTGGALVALFTDARVLDFHTVGAIGSILGAVVVLAVAAVVSRRSLRS